MVLVKNAVNPVFEIELYLRDMCNKCVIKNGMQNVFMFLYKFHSNK